MTDLLTVQEGVEGWHGATVLVKDEATGDHYVISTVKMPWQDEPGESLVYPTDEHGNGLTWDHVAGDLGYSAEDARLDLATRIAEGTLLSSTEADEHSREMAERDYDQFVAWVNDGGDPDLADGVITFAKERREEAQNA
jgi:hypothetical protein